MTRQELEDLGREDDITAEAIKMLLEDETFFEYVFEHNLAPNMLKPLRDWMGDNEHGQRGDR